ncbi:MAG TPA: HepT-like ribonuclease domain-containing protein [Longimicrobium sp.]|nr:HepT-like ribonuclease domain-containing protein [Longimicrobium sp.]
MLVWYSEFAHYSINLLALVYPLDRAQYRSHALERRTSYAYLTDIVEGASRLMAEMFQAVGVQEPRSYREKFEQAEKLDLIPSVLALHLHDLKNLRNAVVHENPRIDADLLLHPRIGEICAVGFSLFEVFLALWISRQVDQENTPRVVRVDRDYLLHALEHPERYRTRNPQSPSWNTADLSGARHKLQSDNSIPVIIVDQPKIVRLLSCRNELH